MTSHDLDCVCCGSHLSLLPLQQEQQLVNDQKKDQVARAQAADDFCQAAANQTGPFVALPGQKQKKRNQGEIAPAAAPTRSNWNGALVEVMHIAAGYVLV